MAEQHGTVLTSGERGAIHPTSGSKVRVFRKEAGVGRLQENELTCARPNALLCSCRERGEG